MQDTKLSALEYALYGALCAAKHETGPEGARRMYRLQERVDNWDDQEVATALLHLIELGWIVQQPVNEFGYIYFEAVPHDTDQTDMARGSASCRPAVAPTPEG